MKEKKKPVPLIDDPFRQSVLISSASGLNSSCCDDLDGEQTKNTQYSLGLGLSPKHKVLIRNY